MWRSAGGTCPRCQNQHWHRRPLEILPFFYTIGPSLAFYRNDTECVPTRVFQHPPALDLVFSACAKGFEAGHFRIDIVGFDVYMHASWSRPTF